MIRKGLEKFLNVFFCYLLATEGKKQRRIRNVFHPLYRVGPYIRVHQRTAAGLNSLSVGETYYLIACLL